MNTNTSCPDANKVGMKRDMGLTITLSDSVLNAGYAVVMIIFLNIIGEERQKSLLANYRRLGVFESAYWVSWVISIFPIVLITAALVAIVAESTDAYIFNAISPMVLFNVSICYLFNILATACFITTVATTSTTQTGFVVSYLIAVVISGSFMGKKQTFSEILKR